jgi:hypothetical protein
MDDRTTLNCVERKYIDLWGMYRAWRWRIGMREYRALMIPARTKFVLAARMDHRTTLNCVGRKYIDLWRVYGAWMWRIG